MKQLDRAVEIFCCYAHKDKDYLDELKKHLSPLRRQNVINVWHDGDISAGVLWDEEIKEHLNEARIILLLISSDFIDSNYCYSIEMHRALERHKRREARVIPIILRHVSDWDKVPPGDIQLGQLQALPKGARPVTSWTNYDEAWIEVVEEIGKVVHELPYLSNRRHGHSRRLLPSGRFSLLVGGTLGLISLLVVLILLFKPILFMQGGSTLMYSISSIHQVTPSCEVPDPRISWTTYQSHIQCERNQTLLIRDGDWNGQEPSRLALLLLSFPYQSFPSHFHMSVTVLALWDPAERNNLGANHGGCGGVTLHLSEDRQTYDSLSVCRDGTYSFGQLIAGNVVGSSQYSMMASTTGQYVMDISVEGKSIVCTISNTNGVSQPLHIQGVNESSYAIAFHQSWRNQDATAGFKNFNLDS